MNQMNQAHVFGHGFFEHLELREGYRQKVYTDSLGKRTIGIGTLMPLTETECKKHDIPVELRDSDDLELNKQQAVSIAEGRLERNWDELVRLRGGIIYKLPDDVKDALAHVVFQLGPAGLNGFPSMWRALDNGNYEEAIVQARDSRWYKQTPVRTDDLTDVFERYV